MVVIALDLETMQNEGDKYKEKKGRRFRVELKKKEQTYFPVNLNWTEEIRKRTEWTEKNKYRIQIMSKIVI